MVTIRATEVRCERSQVPGVYRYTFYRGERVLGAVAISDFGKQQRLLERIVDARKRSHGEMSYIPGGWRYLAVSNQPFCLSVDKPRSQQEVTKMQVEWIMYLRQANGTCAIDFGLGNGQRLRMVTSDFKQRMALVELVRRAIDTGKGYMYPELEGWYFSCPKGQTIELPLKHRRKEEAIVP